MKKNIILVVIMAGLLLLSVGCSSEAGGITIEPKTDSDYTRTFSELNLGQLWDFDFYLPEANHRSVHLWVEKYSDGKKDEQFEASLTYGNSPTDEEKGRLGLGLINGEMASLFLYGPGVKSQPQIAASFKLNEGLSAWHYAFDKKQTLELGTPYVLAAFRQTMDNTLRSGYDLTNEEEIQQMLEDDTNVLLLKIKIEENKK
ncbi:hypothetical protein [Bacillus ndiopicus]|uniref:hypothetical protein n=1 Tax=Bacillus ndiopicus TaxID=1347368 RepID=UPI0005A74EE2|nr:hypothetical protein [Bacillus ndiopicus]